MASSFFSSQLHVDHQIKRGAHLPHIFGRLPDRRPGSGPTYRRLCEHALQTRPQCRSLSSDNGRTAQISYTSNVKIISKRREAVQHKKSWGFCHALTPSTSRSQASRRSFWRRPAEVVEEEEDYLQPSLDEDEAWGQPFRLSEGWADPTPENVLALGLTAVVAFIFLQLVSKIVIAALLVVVAALKYTFIAAVLIATVIFFL